MRGCRRMLPSKFVRRGGQLLTRDEPLAYLAHGGLAGLAVGAVQDQDAIEVVYLVLEDPREQAGSFYLEWGARGILTRDRDRCRPLDLDLDAWYREASFELFLDSPSALLDDRIDEHELLFFQGRDKNTLEAAYLVGGEPYPLVLAHGSQHLLRQVGERAVEALHRRGAGFKNRVSEHPDIERHVFYTSSGS